MKVRFPLSSNQNHNLLTVNALPGIFAVKEILVLVDEGRGGVQL